MATIEEVLKAEQGELEKISLDLSPFQITGPEGYRRAHFQLGTIQYASGKRGQILYIKSSLTKDDPLDVLAYKRAHRTFPHQSTADQFFDESQFESYRMLGRSSLASAIDAVGVLEVRLGGIPFLFRRTS